MLNKNKYLKIVIIVSEYSALNGTRWVKKTNKHEVGWVRRWGWTWEALRVNMSKKKKPLYIIGNYQIINTILL